MDEKNIILNLPFDESNGSEIAYDYSSSRADGRVYGAQFVKGKNGNAIKFTGKDTCEVSAAIIPNLSTDFSISLWANGGEIESGSPKKMIWVLNFSGLENFIEVPIETRPNVWFSLAMIKRGSIFSFYVNSSLISTINRSENLQGVSINQDFYGGDYGFGLLDDVKFYKFALKQDDIINESAKIKQLAYFIDGVNFKDYGVFVSNSKGVVGRPKLKAPASVSWDNYHGDAADLNHKFYESRVITLSCFIKAGGKDDFISKMSQFSQLFDKVGSQRLMIDVHPVKPLVYEVYCKDEINVVKKWNDELMVGTFDLKLIEPEPVKRVLKHIRVGESTKRCSITLTSMKLVNIFWGDGSADFDVSGESITISHDYKSNGDYFAVVTGCIDEISKFETNAIIVWNKL